MPTMLVAILASTLEYLKHHTPYDYNHDCTTTAHVSWRSKQHPVLIHIMWTAKRTSTYNEYWEHIESFTYADPNYHTNLLASITETFTNHETNQLTIKEIIQRLQQHTPYKYQQPTCYCTDVYDATLEIRLATITWQNNQIEITSPYHQPTKYHNPQNLTTTINALGGLLDASHHLASIASKIHKLWNQP